MQEMTQYICLNRINDSSGGAIQTFHSTYQSISIESIRFIEILNPHCLRGNVIIYENKRELHPSEVTEGNHSAESSTIVHN